MSYIDRNLMPGERILFRTRKHLIIFLYPVIILLLSFVAINYMHANEILVNLAWVPSAIVLIIWSAVGLNYWTSEFAVTNKRVMMREGFFTRHANELRISTISQVTVDQSLLGQILGYGTVSINAFGAFDAYSMISKPSIFQQCVHEQIDQAVK